MLCPLLSKCQEKVNLEKYLKVCSNMSEDAYKQCPTYQRLAAEQKTPSEWSRLLSPVPSTK